MSDRDDDLRFAGSIPQLYEELLVPLIFAAYADDLARRVAACAPTRVLEIAAGTGVLTRRLAALLPAEVEIVATDLNPPMLEVAQRIGACRPVAWRQADAMALPFDAGAFDAVVCQFGVMFFPDKPLAHAQVHRVLRPRGNWLFNVWDAIAENEIAALVTAALEPLFPDDPPRFMARVPHGYSERDAIARDLRAGGFVGAARIETVAARSRAESARSAAIAYCQGTPLRSEIESRDAARLAEATAAAESAIARRFGAGAVDGRIQAHVVAVGKAGSERA